jgi:hypothetical protein
MPKAMGFFNLMFFLLKNNYCSFVPFYSYVYFILFYLFMYVLNVLYFQVPLVFCH